MDKKVRKLIPCMVHSPTRLALVILTLLHLNTVSSFKVTVSTGAGFATTNVESLTSVTMDICLAKQRFPFDDPSLVQLTSHLGGGASVLRVGGTDQNRFYYDVQSSKTEPFSASTGGKCCEEQGSCQGCVDDCTMPAPYWKTMVEFAQKSGHKLMFGLVPELGNASALVSFSAAQDLPVYAYTFGNELASEAVTAGYPSLRKLISDTFPAKEAPFLAGPDVALNRHASIEDALAGNDSHVQEALSWVRNFTSAVGNTLDVVSWHTYDFHTQDFGMVDHASLHLSNKTKRLWNTTYLDFALDLNDDMRQIAKRNAPHAGVWLTESDSVCHQGTDGVTNAYLNSLWLVNRLGMLAERNVSMMARQSLVGYNYSLLGNWPVEPLKPNPDYFTTILFRRLLGNRVLETTIGTAVETGNHGTAARAFAFCAGKATGLGLGAVAVAMINFHEEESAEFSFAPGLGDHQAYLLTPGSDPVVEGFMWSSREVLLNGVKLQMGEDGSLPSAITGSGTDSSKHDIVLLPLTVGFAVFPAANVADCATR